MKFLKILLGAFLIIAVFASSFFIFSFLNIKDETKVVVSEVAQWQSPPVTDLPSVESQMTEEELRDESFLTTQAVRPIKKGTIRVPILLYHQIGSPPGNDQDSYWVSPEMFDKQMRWLAENKYNVIPLDNLTNYLQTGKNKPADKSVIITFDDGTIGQYTSAFPILKKYHYNATFFIVPTWADKGSTKTADYMSWDQIQELSDYGMKIGSHNYSHIKMGTAEDYEVVFEPTESKKVLEEKLGRKITTYAYPAGDFDARAITAVQNSDYSTALSTEKNIDHDLAEIFHIGRMHIDNDIPYFKARVQGKWFK